jgi:hypothetical protein
MQDKEVDYPLSKEQKEELQTLEQSIRKILLNKDKEWCLRIQAL